MLASVVKFSRANTFGASSSFRLASKPNSWRSVSTRPALHPGITPKVQGEKGTKNYRVFLYDNQEHEVISPLHDVMLFGPSVNPGETIVRAVIEIPRGTNAKMEISKDEDKNPIKQDIKNGELRFMKHGKLPWNYGAIPQTYSSPNNPVLGLKIPGDKDPLDIIDIGEKTWATGNVVEVRVLGALCLIDEGEADWKIIGLNTNDPKAPFVHDARDLQFHFPNVVDQIREWYRVYKVAEGKGENKYAFNGQLLAREHATEVILNGSTDYRRSAAYLKTIQATAQAQWDAAVAQELHDNEEVFGGAEEEHPKLSAAQKTSPLLPGASGGPQVH